MLGCKTWVAQIARRGGSPVLFEAPYTSLSCNKQANSPASASISVPLSGPHFSPACCELLNEVQPWRDELVLWRDGSAHPWVGPITEVSVNAEGGGINALDLSAWLGRRFMEQESMLMSGDAAEVFKAFAEYGIALDPSINMDVVAREVGTQVVRRILGTDFHRVSDLMGELSRTAVDYLMVGRKMLCGDVEGLLPPGDIVIHDEGVVSAEVVKAGGLLSTDVVVFGQTLVNASRPVTGRATRGVSEFGLLQDSFAELLIDDNESAQRNAESRQAAMLPAPLQVSAQLSESAHPSYDDLMPMRPSNVQLGQVAGCIEVSQRMRLESVDVSVEIGDDGSTEQIGVNLIPAGLGGVEDAD